MTAVLWRESKLVFEHVHKRIDSIGVCVTTGLSFLLNICNRSIPFKIDLVPGQAILSEAFASSRCNVLINMVIQSKILQANMIICLHSIYDFETIVYLLFKVILCCTAKKSLFFSSDSQVIRVILKIKKKERKEEKN